MSEARAIDDPCPFPDTNKKRRLNTKEKLLYAPMSNLGELTYDEVRTLAWGRVAWAGFRMVEDGGCGGGWRVEGGGFGGGWRMAGMVEGGGWRVWWRVEGGGYGGRWRVADLVEGRGWRLEAGLLAAAAA